MTLSKLTAEWVAVNETNVGENVNNETELHTKLIRWRTAFKHIHVSNHIDDCCAKCGLDLRDDIHIRAVRETTMTIDQALQLAISDHKAHAKIVPDSLMPYDSEYIQRLEDARVICNNVADWDRAADEALRGGKE